MRQRFQIRNCFNFQVSVFDCSDLDFTCVYLTRSWERQSVSRLKKMAPQFSAIILPIAFKSI